MGVSRALVEARGSLVDTVHSVLRSAAKITTRTWKLSLQPRRACTDREETAGKCRCCETPLLSYPLRSNRLRRAWPLNSGMSQANSAEETEPKPAKMREQIMGPMHALAPLDKAQIDGPNERPNSPSNGSLSSARFSERSGTSSASRRAQGMIFKPPANKRAVS